ncbi:hypothetical protein F3Y22_tig00110998pilonHSYRG00107 [Hibiscus syriacus]|uniref:Oxidoreductase N-terminal domain-containing protein n=1 Tax=Hibiscus syriacus TaxID=106335 RepID=A0A6A2Z9F9_HIBSY|nr:2-alkenal reductase (NADP(+)-dependent)-like [Hibiscus syriacus]KAE8688166.1 hypothetical protein F3Y22_tig00110998pilonHSYRG00107 [Hibiscus syriacus]
MHHKTDFKLKSSPLTLSMDPGSDEVIVQNLYVSIDPYQLNRMKSYSSSQERAAYAIAISPGEAINTYGVGRVVASTNPKFEKGDIVAGLPNWGEFTLVKAGGMLNKLDSIGFPLSYHIGILGVSGLSKETDLKSTLKRYFTDGIDIYFDNVGAEMQAEAVSNMNMNGRVAVCGMISEYTDDRNRATPSMMDVIYKRILSTTCGLLRTGKILVLADISDGVETIPSAFIDLFTGQNIGIKIVQERVALWN